MRHTLIALAACLSLTSGAAAQQTITAYTQDLEKQDGYFPLYWDAGGGRLLLEIPRLGEEFLYLPSLATGIGSEPLGLDRGLIGQSMLADSTGLAREFNS